MRGSLTDSACRLGGFGLSNSAVLTKCGPYPHRSTPAPAEFKVRFTDAGDGIARLDDWRGIGAQPVHARASAAWTRLANGLWASVAAGNLRSYYHEDGTYMGALFEQAAINQCLWNRDLTNAAWVKVGAATIAKDGTGMDGVANSCSTMTCGAANDTVMQTVVLANNARQGAFWIKRLVGTGTVEITLDGGATWTNVTSTLSALHFRWCGKVQTLVGPTLGIRMGTIGDQIAVDMALVELSYNGAYECVETPIPTTVAAVTRQADALGGYDAANIDDTEGTIFVETSSLFETNGGGRNIVHTQAGGTAGAAYITGSVTNSRITIHDGTNAVTARDLSISQFETLQRSATSWGASSGVMWACYAGSLLNQSDLPSYRSFDGQLSPKTGVWVSRGTNTWRGTIKSIDIWKRQLDINIISALMATGRLP